MTGLYNAHKVIKVFYFHGIPTRDLTLSWGEEIKLDKRLLGRQS